MKNRLPWVFFFILLYTFVFAQKTPPAGGYSGVSIVVTSGSSADGSMILAHNAYAPASSIPSIYKVRETSRNIEKLQYPDGKKIHVESSLGFLWMHVPGVEFVDSYINEYGLSITVHSTPARKELVEENTGKVDYWLPYLMAKGTMTAREAIALAADNIKKYGFAGSGETFVISDMYEAWVMCVLPGKHWVAERIPDMNVSVLGAFYPITEINLSDEDFYLASDGILDFAIEKGWFHKDVNVFNFRTIFGAPESYQNHDNIYRVLAAINKISKFKYEENDGIPLFFPPKKQLSLSEMKSLLRSHSSRNLNDPSHGKGYVSVCDDLNVYSFVAQMRNWLPKEIGTLVWFSPLQPCMQEYIPLYVNIGHLPSKLSPGSPDKALLNQSVSISTSPGNKNLYFTLSLRNKAYLKDYSIEKMEKIKKKLFELEKNYIEKIEEKENKIMKSISNQSYISTLRDDITKFNLKLISKSYR